ncbi:coenzyme F420-0:L-glutamate ligase [Paraburkholderia sp. SIMBA_030]|uniref:coenzyme F420-0:L-glutamate ligase n=1 Tax=Paraburkholderia sp. SIMBA_030 TaxID=3085773 RepID=UPI00397E67CC
MSIETPTARQGSREYLLWAPGDVPLVSPGTDIAKLVLDLTTNSGRPLADGDVVVLAQKIVSKAENRLVNLRDTVPSKTAIELGEICGKDARLIEVILRESTAVVRCVPGLIIVRHRQGYVAANAGVDHSNVSGPCDGEWVLLLPVDPDASAKNCCLSLRETAGVEVGVAIIDSWGRAWRIGTCGACIGAYGLATVDDLRGQLDLFGRRLESTIVGIGDELAAAASLLMGQSSEGTPIVIVRGTSLVRREGAAAALVRPLSEDLFK